MDLQDFFNANPKIALGFSGGADSVYLLYAAKAMSADIQPYFIKTQFTPKFELDDAKRAAKALNSDLKVIEFDILSDKYVAKNSADRCYFCKKALFLTLKNHAEADGYTAIIDGTNASDSYSDRPGMKALLELNIKSPLRECGLTKDKIRGLSKKAGLFTWNKPAYACLATRIPTGKAITEQLLRKIENAENSLFNLGFSDFRVRIYHEAAKLQFKPEQIQRAVDMRNEIISALQSEFDIVLMDLQNR